MRFGATSAGIIWVLIGSGAACAQCAPQWSGFDPPFPSLALSVWDRDGSGPERPVLVAAQPLPNLGNGYEIQAGRYDGRAWRPIGQNFRGVSASSLIRAFATSTTSGVGSPAPGLYAGGRFLEAGGEPANNIAHWDGTRWRQVGSGTPGPDVYSLLMFDEDGAGPSEANLFVGGIFFEVAGIDKPGLVRWDGSEFSAVGGGLTNRLAGTIPYASAMIEFDEDGPGPREPALYAAGGFDFADGLLVNSIARWDGSNWEAVGGGLDSGVNALAVFDADGPGPGPPMLYAGGGFIIRDPAGNWIRTLARFNGTDWEAVPGWDTGGVESLEVFDDDGDGPNRPALFVSGTIATTNGVPTYGIAKWDGRQWYGLGSGLGCFAWAHATDMQVFDEDDDPATPAGLYVAGNFFCAGGIPTIGLARWGCPSPICFADCDESTGLGVLDIFDFLCFQNSFVNQDPYACNCDPDPACDIFDFLCFQTAFVNGCP